MFPGKSQKRSSTDEADGTDFSVGVRFIRSIR
jgi:hypothetical protein